MKPNYLFALILAFMACLPACRKHSICTKCYPAGNDSVTVYAAGYVYDGASNTATYWKNGQAVLLPPATNGNSNSFAYAMAVSGKDIYVAGTSPMGTVYWRNGVPQLLTQSNASANAIAVAG